MSKEPWYGEGLQFQCTGCGGCCTGAPGYVWVGGEEIAAMADALAMEPSEFEREFVRRVGKRKSLIELSNGDCIFFDNSSRRCRLYGARPLQCRTWPFWESNLDSPRRWQEVCRACPGSGRGPAVALRDIQRLMSVVRL
jgi:uncharacterized protein